MSYYRAHATRPSRAVRARAEEAARRAVGYAAQPLQGARQSPAAGRSLDRVFQDPAPRHAHAARAARAGDPARRAAHALGVRVGATSGDGAQGRRVRGANSASRLLENLVPLRRAGEGRAGAWRGGHARPSTARNLCRSDEAFRPSRLRGACDRRRVLRHGRPDAGRHGRAARARGAKLLAQAAVKTYRYYEFVMAAFVTVLICSNLIGPAKAVQVDLPLVGAVVFGAGVLFFPISYVFGDILTEVYGYARARRVIWAGFAGLAFASFMAYVVVALPPSPKWPHQQAYELVFGNTWRIALASMFAYFCGEFANSFVLAKLKIRTAGKWLWTRTIGSTIVGEAVDSSLFYPLAFYNSGIIPNDKLPAVMLAQFVGKVAVEVIFTPLTYKIVGFLNRAENEDYYDRTTDFTHSTLKA